MRPRLAARCPHRIVLKQHLNKMHLNSTCNIFANRSFMGLAPLASTPGRCFAMLKAIMSLLSGDSSVYVFSDLEKSGLVWLNGCKENIRTTFQKGCKDHHTFIASMRKHSLKNPVTLSPFIDKYTGARGPFF